jgi:ribosomal protein S18 acetylase RimI-like enzyme
MIQLTVSKYLPAAREGSHRGLVRAPAKRLPRETGVEGSNPSPSAIKKMSNPTSIVTLTPTNYTEYGCRCFLNPKNEGHLKKLGWLKERFAEGMTIKHLFIEGEKKPVGFIEYVPGEYAWRAVDANGYLFIHCILISPNKNKEKGYGSQLVGECIEDARKVGVCGVAVVTSDGAFIATKELFLKNGFEVVAEAGNYELLVFKLKERSLPRFNDWQKQLNNYQGLNIVYSNQCPWVARSIPELTEIAGENGLELKVTKLETAKQAQNAPSIYSVFSLVYDGKLIADHYISNTRFLNILKKELKLVNAQIPYLDHRLPDEQGGIGEAG